MRKERNDIWNYIPWIVIAVAVFTMIWWSININAHASGLQTVSVNNGYASYYQDILGGYRYYKTTYHVPYTNRCCAYVSSSYNDTQNGVTYAINSYVIVTDYTSTYSDNVTSRLYWSTNGTQWTETDSNDEQVFRLSRINTTNYYEVGLGGNNNLNGVPLFSSQAEALNYMATGDETGNLNHTAVPVYGGNNIPVPEGYYGQYTNIGTLHTYDDVYKNQLILTNYSSEYKVAVCYRIRYASDIKVKRESSSSIYVDVWHDSVKYKEWHVQSNWYDNAVPEYDNGVYYVTQAIDGTTAEAIKNEVMATYTNYDVAGNISSSNLFPTLKGKLSDEYYNNLAGDRFFMWQVMDYTVQYYKVEANGDMTFGDIATFSIEMPYLLKWNILRNGFFTMPDGYGQTNGVVSGLNSGSITTDTVLTGDNYALNTGSETSSGIGSISSSFNGSSANITEMTNTLNNFKVFIGNVPNLMATWFGFMPNWIWSLIALEFGFLIVFGLVKKVIG